MPRYPGHGVAAPRFSTPNHHDHHAPAAFSVSAAMTSFWISLVPS